MRGGIEITGVAQRDAWRRRVLPPAEQVRPGLWSVPVPIPDNPLRYTLCYAFTGGGHVVLVDPGWDGPPGRQAVTAGLAAAGAAPQDVAGVVVTHIHPDHHGMSGWFRECGAWIAMHPAEAQTLPGRIWRDRDARDDRRWLLGHGVPEEDLAALTLDPGQLDDALGMAEPDRLISDGDRVPVPGRDVRALWTPGHTPGHLCLHDAAAGVLLTGDHLLPRISARVPVPRHRRPRGRSRRPPCRPRRRAADRDRPARTAHCVGGGRPADLVPRVGPLHGMMRRLALAETVAHLHHLSVTRAVHPAGSTPLRWYRAET